MVDLSVVVPAYNEEKVIVAFHRRLSMVLDKLSLNSEIVYVNDGSRDNTLNLLKGLLAADKRVRIVDLSRNFGKEHAMTAGLDKTEGEAVIVIDADLQDQPELIPDMVAKWQEGFDVVLMKRASRRGESFIKKLTASLFYKFIRKISYVNIPENVGDFRLMSRKVIEALKSCGEETRFMKGLFAWVGFKTYTIEYERDGRLAGNTTWNYWKLWNFALEGITSFSTAPLKIATYIGIGVVSFAVFFGLGDFLIPTLSDDGLLIFCITFIGGIQLIILGILGEYLSRVFLESKKRPLYIIDKFYKSGEE